jgi:hypothetical protein
VWAEDSEPTKIGIDMEVTSNSTLDTEFRLMTKSPFSLDKDHFQLGPKEQTKFIIFFDPSLNSDRMNTIFNGKLNVCHVKHPYRDAIDLRGQVE